MLSREVRREVRCCYKFPPQHFEEFSQASWCYSEHRLLLTEIQDPSRCTGSTVNREQDEHRRYDPYPVINEGGMLRREAVDPPPITTQGLHDPQVIHFVPFLQVQGTRDDAGANVHTANSTHALRGVRALTAPMECHRLGNTCHVSRGTVTSGWQQPHGRP